MRRLLAALCISVMAMTVSPAFAQPPPSCASKFVGRWKTVGGPNAWMQSGATLNANGTAIPHCTGVPCVAVQNWTCSGDTHIILSPTPGQAQLLPSGRLVGYGIEMVRIGRAAIASQQQPSSSPPARKTCSAKDINVSTGNNWGARYTLENTCGRRVIVVVQTKDGQNRCERDVLIMGPDPNITGKLSVYSYFSTRPSIVFVCSVGTGCDFLSVRKSYDKDC
jgi:hypothetical protein